MQRPTPDSERWRLLNFALEHPRSAWQLIDYDARLFVRRSISKYKGSASSSISAAPQFHCVYFTCRAHYNYLLLSVKSLMLAARPRIGRVFIYHDRRDPLTRFQRKELSEILPSGSLFRGTRHAMSWGGTRLIDNELTAFNEILPQLGTNDTLVKIDSDTLFLSGKIFDQVDQSNADMVGQRFYSSPTSTEYAQGGCYFLKTRAVKALTSTYILKAALLSAIAAKPVLPELPEDFFITSLARSEKLSVSLIDFFTTPQGSHQNLSPETASAFISAAKEKHSVIHFEKNKSDIVILGKAPTI